MRRVVGSRREVVGDGCAMSDVRTFKVYRCGREGCPVLQWAPTYGDFGQCFGDGDEVVAAHHDWEEFEAVPAEQRDALRARVEELEQEVDRLRNEPVDPIYSDEGLR